MTSALNGGLRAPIDVAVSGQDAAQDHRIAAELARRIAPLRGAVDVRVQQRVDAPAIRLTVDRIKAAVLGLDMEGVIQNVLTAVSGSASFDPQIWVDPKSGIDYFLAAQFHEKAVDRFEDLRDIPIRGPQQQRSVPLKSVAKLEIVETPSEISHVDLEPVADVYLDAQGRDVGGLAKDIRGIIRSIRPPQGVRVTLRGEVSQMNRAASSLARGFVLAAVLVYFVLVVQFRSFLLPLIIMTAVPLGLAGIAITLAATRTYFSIQAAIGGIFMIGIAVANGVLLLQFIEHRRRAGETPEAAIVNGARLRLRPILMTSLASVFGLLPMAIGYGRGSEANVPLGRAVIGGQLVSVTLTLFVVPILYRLLTPDR